MSIGRIETRLSTCLLCVALFLFMAAHGAAQDWYVTQDGAGTQSGDSWANALSADDLVTSNVIDGITVWIMEGTYPFAPDEDLVIRNGGAVIGGFPSSLSDPGLGDRDPAAFPTIFDGQGLGRTASRMVRINPVSTLDGVVIQDAATSNGSTPGVYAKSANILNCTFRNLTMETVSKDNFGGAAVLMDGNNIVTNIDNCVFENCSVLDADGKGGAVVAYRGFTPSDPTDDDSTLAVMNITNSTFIGNSCAGDGGALGGDRCRLTITNCVFAGNTAGGTGGAIGVKHALRSQVANNTFYGNSSVLGATVAIDDASGDFSSLDLVNNLFSSNNPGPDGFAAQITNTAFAFTVANNMYHNEIGTHDGVTQDDGGHVVQLASLDAQFANAAGNNFTLLPTSSAIDAGLDSFGSPELIPATDQVGNVRFDGDGQGGSETDIGALENQSGPLTANYYVTPTGAGSGDGSSWANAIAWDNVVPVGGNTAYDDQVFFLSEGTYATTGTQGIVLRDGSQFYGGFPSTGNPGFADRDPGAYPTIIDGNALSGVVRGGFLIRANPSAAIIDGITVQNVTSNNNYCAMRVKEAIIRNCTFKDLTLTSVGSDFFGGAAIMIDGGGTFAQVSDCVFINCQLTDADGSGGAISADRGFTPSGPDDTSIASAIINRCLFIGNGSAGAGGALGGDRCLYDVRNSIFADNTAAGSGSAVGVEDALRSTIVNSTFYNNTSSAIKGATVMIQDGGANATSLTLVNCLFSSNTDGTDGAAFVAANAVNGWGASNTMFHNENLATTGTLGSYVDLGGNIDATASADMQFDTPDAPDYNFRLVDHSLAIDAGVNTYGSPSVVPLRDYLGNGRHDGNNDASVVVDIGAIENQIAVPVELSRFSIE